MDSTAITFWLNNYLAGDSGAAERLWNAYYRRLVGMARGRLHGRPRAAADEEDVALSAMDSFFRGARAGRFPRLADRDDLWQVLLVITARKVADLRQHDARLKRGGGRAHTSADDVLAACLGREPTPDYAAQLVEECDRLLAVLEAPELRTIALDKLEGYTNEEIAGRLGRSVSTVERKLGVIRKCWQASA